MDVKRGGTGLGKMPPLLIGWCPVSGKVASKM